MIPSIVTQRLPGLLRVTAVAVVAMFVGPMLPNIGTVTMALLLGAILAQMVPPGASHQPGIKWAESVLLGWAIVLLGLDLNWQSVMEIGGQSMLVVMLVVVGSVLAALFVGRLMGMAWDLRMLLGVGSAICGSSAMAAAAPMVAVLKAQREGQGPEGQPADVNEALGTAMAVVNLIGVFGIFAAPIIIKLCNLSTPASGLLIGGSLPAVGHVVASGFTVGEDVGAVATLIKMGRILLLGPMLLFLAWRCHRGLGGNGERPTLVPWFVVGFVALSVAASLGLVPDVALPFLRRAGKILLTIAMAAIGLRISLRALFQQGPRALALAGVVLVLQLAVLTVAGVAVAG